MKEIKNALFTQNYTKVYCENDSQQKFNAPHHFTVKAIDPITLEADKVVGEINFQEGPIKEFGINGVANEDLLLMILTRLKSFENNGWSCKENQMAIDKIEEAVMWLRKRTLEREARNVEGTSVK